MTSSSTVGTADLLDERRAAIRAAARRGLDLLIGHHRLPAPKTVTESGRSLFVVLAQAEDVTQWSWAFGLTITARRDVADDGAIQYCLDLQPDPLRLPGVTLWVSWVSPWIPAPELPRDIRIGTRHGRTQADSGE